MSRTTLPGISSLLSASLAVRMAAISAVALALCLPADIGARAQDKPRAPEAAQAGDLQPDASLNDIGLPVYTSDGEHLGQVVHVATYGEKPALKAEIGLFLGLGTTTAIIPAGMFVRRDGRIALKLTAAEVRDTIAKQR